jgi:hypothetical protein
VGIILVRDRPQQALNFLHLLKQTRFRDINNLRKLKIDDPNSISFNGYQDIVSTDIAMHNTERMDTVKRF